MSRVFIQVIVPLLLPFIMYFLWMWVLRHRAGATGTEAPSINSTGLFWSLISGVILLIAGLMWLALSSGFDVDAGRYQPSKYENGRIVAPTFGNQNTDGKPQ